MMAAKAELFGGFSSPGSFPRDQGTVKMAGGNPLGFALIEVRDELRRVTQYEALCDWSVLEQL